MDKSTIIPDPQKWIKILDKMLADKKFKFAQDFLSDVRQQVELKDEITLEQTKAVLNIRRSTQEWDE